MIARSSNASPEANIISLIYLNRLSSMAKLVLMMSNWRAVWLTCLVLAEKMWSDRKIHTSSFVNLVPPLTKIDLRNFESRVLSLMEFTTTVKASLYARYYFELRQLFTTVMGFAESEWQLEPLSRVQAIRLEAVTTRSLRSSSSKHLHSPVTPSDEKNDRVIRAPQDLCKENDSDDKKSIASVESRISGVRNIPVDEYTRPQTSAVSSSKKSRGRFVLS
jgi:hypothetical protein